MTAFLSFEDAEGKLFPNPNGGEHGQPDYCGYIEFVQGEGKTAPRMRVPLVAFADGSEDAHRYRLDLSGIEGFMVQQKDRLMPAYSDFDGTIGRHQQLWVAAWREYNPIDGWHLRVRSWGFLFSQGEWTKSTEAAVF